MIVGIGLFLPLFPFSVVLDRLLAVLAHPLPRVVLILGWPHAGILLAAQLDGPPPAWLAWWSVTTGLVYGFRMLTMRDLNRWVSFLGTSQWTLLWVELIAGVDATTLHTHALAFSLPLALASLECTALDRRFGAAYSHVYGGLASVLPRLSAVFAVTVLAAVATPLWAGFLVLLHILLAAPSTWAMATVLLSSLLWSWAGVRVLQGLLVGPVEDGEPVNDLSRSVTVAALFALAALMAGGLLLTGDLA